MATHQSEIPLPLAMKLASLVVHAQEMTVSGSQGRWFDIAAITSLAEDPEVTAWLATFDPALLPEKRT